ncbi:TraX family protein [Alkalibacterium putridalgicola]|uniref:Fimbrial assembly protein fimC n=1 Tax=Alkalibacterium putridalgicola TaxID=426703 RepID=A0A1H7WYQ3_9LACT|nr:TraX family protein [Alkalibacterium putridalgicola]GEK88693.1 fimbrial assembly protein fimC [Alkalibacterium putridalgicola]SEM26673.1 TraX protein [Alkalibacterium putridalgicola]
MEKPFSTTNIKNIGFNANVIKIVAVTSMFVDHFSRVITEEGTATSWGLHLFGRLAAPLIAYLVAEGHYYTSDKLAYAKRLFIFALISHIPYIVYFGFGFFQATSVFWSLLMGLIALTAATNDELSDIWKVLIVGASLILAAPANWNYIAVLWVLNFGLFRERMGFKLTGFVVITVLFYIIPGLQQYGTEVTYRFGSLLALPFFYYYNRKPGKRTWFTKWAFYWFYPLHLIFLYALKMF